MKTHFLILCFVFMSFIVKAQDTQSNELIWPQPEARWSYCIIGYGGVPVNKEIWGLKGDSLIDGVRYDIIGLLDEKKTSIKPDLLTRCHNDTVFRYINNKEYPYFKFDMEIGDVFTTFRSAGWMYSWNDSACSSVLPLRVFNKDIININGMELNRYFLADTLYQYLYGGYYTPVYELVDRIGVINAYPFINNAEGPDCSISSDYSTVEVSKYEDNVYSLSLSECIISSVYEHPTESMIEVYPNPASTYITFNLEIDGGAAYDIEILSILGQRVLCTIIDGDNKTINVTNLPDGTYMIALSPIDYPTKHSIYQKIIIRHNVLTK